MHKHLLTGRGCIENVFYQGWTVLNDIAWCGGQTTRLSADCIVTDTIVHLYWQDRKIR